MSTDGDIEISVRAEGAEDAAGDLAEQGGGGGNLTGGGGGGGKKSSFAKGGIIGGLLASLDSIISIVQPILDLLNAFLAPVAVILLRLLQPAMRLLIKILPYWFGLMQDTLAFLDWWEGIMNDVYKWLFNLPGAIMRELSAAWSWLSDGASNIGTEVWNAIKTKFNDLVRFVKTLPAKLGQKIASVVPGVEFNGDDGSTGSAAADLATNENVRQGTKVILRGGLETFVEGAERETGVDLLP